MSDRKPVIISEEQLEEQRQYIQQIRLMPDAPKSYHVVTYGCQMNAHDSEILAGCCATWAWRKPPTANRRILCCLTPAACATTPSAAPWQRDVAQGSAQEESAPVIGVCGCMIQQPGMAEKILKQYRFVDLAFGTANLYRLPELMLKSAGKRPRGGGGGGAEHDCRGSARAAPAP